MISCPHLHMESSCYTSLYKAKKSTGGGISKCTKWSFHLHSAVTERWLIIVTLIPDIALALSSPTPQQSSGVIDSLTAENTSLQLRLGAELSDSLPFRWLFLSRADHLTTYSFIAHGPNSLEHLHSFSIPSLMHEVKIEATDLLCMFKTLGNPHRNIQSEHLAVEEVKGMVSLFAPLNARSREAKGLHLPIAVMLNVGTL